MKNKEEKVLKEKKGNKIFENISSGASKVGLGIVDGVGTATSKASETVLNALDVNGDGELDVQDIITLSLRINGVLVDRAEFLRETLTEIYPDDVVNSAISNTPQIAEIPLKKLNKIANKISKQKNKFLTGVVTRFVMPKKVSAIASIPTEITMYYAHVLYTIQKLMYLYGFPQIKNENESNELPSETITIFSICIGTMYEVDGASEALKTITSGISSGVDSENMKEILQSDECTKAMKNTNRWFAISIARGVLGSVAKKTVPVVGEIVGGVIASDVLGTDFDALKDTFAETALCAQNLEV